jgi:hypothetical protein
MKTAEGEGGLGGGKGEGYEDFFPSLSFLIPKRIVLKMRFAFEKSLIT